MEWAQKATECTKIVQQCLYTFEEIMQLLEKVDWEKISDGIRKIVGSVDECTTNAAKVIGDISTQYIRYANSYSSVTKGIRKECRTASSLLHTYLDDMPGSGGDAHELIQILPAILEPLSNAIKKSDEAIKEILEGFAITYGKLSELKTILEGGLKSVKSCTNKLFNTLGTIGIVMGCMAAGALGGLVVAGGICWFAGVVGTTVVVAAGVGAGIGAAGGFAGGSCLAEGHREKKDIRKMIEENQDRLTKLEAKIDQLVKKYIPETEEENDVVGAACNATKTLLDNRANRLIQKSCDLMKQCDNYIETDHKLKQKKF